MKNAIVSAPKLGKTAGIVVLNSRGTSTRAEVTDCFVSGDITCGIGNPIYGAMAGGIAAYSCGTKTSSSIIKNCIAMANVTTTNESVFRAGLICGYPNGVSFRSNAAYSGEITIPNGITGDVGRIYGCSTYSNSMERNAANSEITINGITVSQGGKNGEDKSPADMKKKETYESIGWDFENVWTMDIKNGYPVPKSFENNPLKVKFLVTVTEKLSNDIGTISFMVTSFNNLISAVAIVASYTGEKDLKDTKVLDIGKLTAEESKDILAEISKYDEGDEIDIYIWDSMESLRPLCEKTTL